jgi:hypothetical protein
VAGKTQTHILRSIAFGFLALILTCYRPEGLWFWGVGGILIFDFLNNIVAARSCIRMDFEKQIVFRARRLIRVLKVRCFLSIF